MNTNMQAHGSDTDNGDEDDIPEPIISLLDSNSIDISCEELTKFDMKNMKKYKDTYDQKSLQTMSDNAAASHIISLDAT